MTAAPTASPGPPRSSRDIADHAGWCLRAKVWSVCGQLRVTHSYTNSWNCRACAQQRVAELVEHLDDVVDAAVLYLGSLGTRPHAAARKQASRRGAGWVTATPVDLDRQKRLILVDTDARPGGQELRRLSRRNALILLAARLGQGGYRRVRAYGTWEPAPPSCETNPDWEHLGTASYSTVDEKLAEVGVERWAKIDGPTENRVREALDENQVGWKHRKPLDNTQSVT